jgi:hypothetical protein
MNGPLMRRPLPFRGSGRALAKATFQGAAAAPDLHDTWFGPKRT